MKHSVILLFALVFLFLCNSITNAQLLNASFEEWDSFSPRYWHTVYVPGELEPVNRSSIAQQGNYSVKLEVKEFAGTPYSGHIQSMDSVNSLGHPVTERYAALSGYYKFAPLSTAELLIVVSVYSNSFALIGVGGTDIFDPAENWTQFNVPIEYFFDDPAGSIIVSISIVDTSSNVDLSTVGSIAYIDNLSLGTATSVFENDDIPQNFSLEQNYPNPFNPLTKIEYSIPETGNKESEYVEIRILDFLGREAVQLVGSNHKPGNYEVVWDAQSFSSGIYFYQIKTGSFIETKKMILLK